jgi:hypothetical protein
MAARQWPASLELPCFTMEIAFPVIRLRVSQLLDKGCRGMLRARELYLCQGFLHSGHRSAGQV